MRVGIVDLGGNTARLLVAELGPGASSACSRSASCSGSAPRSSAPAASRSPGWQRPRRRAAPVRAGVRRRLRRDRGARHLARPSGHQSRPSHAPRSGGPKQSVSSPPTRKGGWPAPVRSRAPPRMVGSSRCATSAADRPSSPSASPRLCRRGAVRSTSARFGSPTATSVIADRGAEISRQRGPECARPLSALTPPPPNVVQMIACGGTARAVRKLVGAAGSGETSSTTLSTSCGERSPGSSRNDSNYRRGVPMSSPAGRSSWPRSRLCSTSR